MRRDITIIGHQETQVAFKNCATFTKIDEITKDDAENLRFCHANK